MKPLPARLAAVLVLPAVLTVGGCMSVAGDGGPKPRSSGGPSAVVHPGRRDGGAAAAPEGGSFGDGAPGSRPRVSPSRPSASARSPEPDTTRRPSHGPSAKPSHGGGPPSRPSGSERPSAPPPGPSGSSSPEPSQPSAEPPVTPSAPATTPAPGAAG